MCIFITIKKAIPEEMECHTPCRKQFFFCGNFLCAQHLSQGCSLNYHRWMENYAKRRKNKEITFVKCQDHTLVWSRWKSNFSHFSWVVVLLGSHGNRVSSLSLFYKWRNKLTNSFNATELISDEGSTLTEVHWFQSQCSSCLPKAALRSGCAPSPKGATEVPSREYSEKDSLVWPFQPLPVSFISL